MDREPTPARRPGEILSGLSRRTFIARSAAGAGALLIAGSSFPEWANATAPPPLSNVFPTPPFSFTYGGTASSTLLSRWTKTTSSTTLADGSVVTTTTWDSGAGFRVRWVATQYPDITNVSWVLYFDNTGTSTSSTLEDVLALDLDVGDAANGPARSDWTIHTGVGSSASTTDYQPLDVSLSSTRHRLFTTNGGRPTNASVPSTSTTFVKNGWPYFNVEWGGRGMLVAVGWPGQWAFEAYRTAAQALTLRAGMCSNSVAADGDHIDTSGVLYLTKVQLAAGETIRSPRIVTQSWTSGTATDAQNDWRRWLYDYQLHQLSGNPPQPMLTATHYRFTADETDHVAWLDTHAHHRATQSTGGYFTNYWIDAGWYASADSGGWWDVGTWDPSSTRFPNGLDPVFDHARGMGLSGVLWFEPERTHVGTYLANNHSSWLLGSGSDKLFDFGNSSAQSWAVTEFNTLLSNAHLDQQYGSTASWYREDHNMDPLPFWNAADPTGYFGITQIHHVMGHLDYWQSILDTNSGMRIDTCASGGRRLDVETLHYAVPLLRSDLVVPSVTAQCQTFGLSSWFPVQGNQSGNFDPNDSYAQRSAMTALFCLPMNGDDLTSNTWDKLPRIGEEWQQVADLYAGDYYPLTTYSTAADVWMAWQCNKSDASRGFVQVFRRPEESGSGSTTFGLQGLDRTGTYDLTLYSDTNLSWTASAGFTGTQGTNQWSYLSRDKSTGADTSDTYSSGAWYGPNGTSGAYVTADSCHPDNSYDAVRKWVAPESGTIRIHGRVYKQETGGGNGVVASVLKNSTTLWSKTIAFDDTIGYSTDDDLAAVEVTAGDAIYFVVSNNGDYAYDGTTWDPTITLMSWTASTCFGATQGDRDWHYEARNASTGAYSDMSYSSGAWYGPGGGSGAYVASGSMSPDNTYDAVRTWVAPEHCRIKITGRAYKQLTGGGDGVIVSVLQNTTSLWSRTIAYNDTTGYSTDADLTDVEVQAGDKIRFVINCNGDYRYDPTYWDPTITILAPQAWLASTGYSGTQGTNDWYYEARDKSTLAYSDMTYSSGVWYGPSGTSGGYVTSGTMHPDNSYDAVRKWVAPRTGRVKIDGRAYKQLTGGGNGVIVRVLRNTTELWSKTIAYDDTTGYTTDADLPNVAVTAGDAIRFVIENNGDWAYDATYWDPEVTELIDEHAPTRTRSQTGASLEDDGLAVTMNAGTAITVRYDKQ